MSDPTPIVGDGVVSFPGAVIGVSAMTSPIDLPPNVAAALQLGAMNTAERIASQNAAISQMAAGVLQAAMARNFDKLGTEEARALSGLNNTALGAPSGKSV